MHDETLNVIVALGRFYCYKTVKRSLERDVQYELLW